MEKKNFNFLQVKLKAKFAKMNKTVEKITFGNRAYLYKKDLVETCIGFAWRSLPFANLYWHRNIIFVLQSCL